ncbi:MAG: 3-oxoacyl-[acyl-carrier protein] reductase [Hydrocarboniphaga sp.]|uniref:SDR family NAD(P)-dependent oxidoreductase n=1 Tax=Hydrocarboniphaga sp. TaxID=2033016 RepID=UPI0026318CBE|nr:SDR family oxidoreductase [Hydrocarboniphaga sp.]MDB5969976.1 3-oxoacyl-[acyl-carrier protein] reductase [Hydrocarboniphaga sp.]
MSVAQALDFSGKRIVVAGASDGIGYGIALAFLDAGAEVTVTGTRPAASYGRDFGGMRFLQLNVAEAESVEALAAQLDEIDALVCCVGTVLYKSQEFQRAGFAAVVDINLTGVMHLCTALQPRLSARRGNIVVLDSIVARTVARNNPAYCASKAGLVQLIRVLAAKWGKAGLRVNGIGPGMVPTKLTANQVSDAAQSAFEKACPLGRYGRPEDIAGVALFLASPLAAYVTGQSLLVDGGISLAGG